MTRSPFSLPNGARFDLQNGQWSNPGEPASYEAPRLARSTRAASEGVGLHNVSIVMGSGPSDVRVNLPDGELPVGARGLVVGPQLKVSGKSILVKNSAIDAQELRFASLFWDRLIVPQNNLVAFALDPDAQFLAEEGLLFRADVCFTGAWDAAQGAAKSFMETLNKLQARDGGRWSLARGENSPSVVPPEELSDGGLTFDVHRVVPVPDKAVPLAEVLEFKARRNAELRALQVRLDEVVGAIMGDPDPDFAKMREMDALSRAIEDHLRVAKESKLPFRLAGFKMKLDKGSVIAAGGAWKGAMHYGLPASIAALAGVAGAVLGSISTEVNWRGRKGVGSPYEYVARYRDELFT